MLALRFSMSYMWPVSSLSLFLTVFHIRHIVQVARGLSSEHSSHSCGEVSPAFPFINLAQIIEESILFKSCCSNLPLVILKMQEMWGNCFTTFLAESPKGIAWLRCIWVYVIRAVKPYPSMATSNFLYPFPRFNWLVSPEQARLVHIEEQDISAVALYWIS